MQYDRAKLRALILYACSKCDPAQLGAVKLHKVLYYVDMIHYAHVGVPVTGATYRKRPFGPTCDQLLPMLRDLNRDKAIEVRDSVYFGYSKKEYIAKESPDLSRLSSDERHLMDDVIDFVCKNNTARTISEFSHNKAWEQAEFGDVLSYISSFHLFPNQVSPEALEWAEKQAVEIEAERSQGNSLDYESYASFRARVLEARRPGFGTEALMSADRTHADERAGRS